MPERVVVKSQHNSICKLPGQCLAQSEFTIVMIKIQSKVIISYHLTLTLRKMFLCSHVKLWTNVTLLDLRKGNSAVQMYPIYSGLGSLPGTVTVQK